MMTVAYDVEKIIDAIVNALERKERITVAIDGPCASGKTTLASKLHARLGGNLFKVDDFFLRPCQRTEARLAEIGGNFDYERLLYEVISPLKEGETVNYRPYVCYKGEFGEWISSPPERLNIVEGSYSTHPVLGDYADVRIFVTVSPKEQIRRIEDRDPVLLSRFINEWIPKETAYFEKFGIKDRCDIIFETEADSHAW